MKPSGQKRQTAGFDHEPEHRTFFPELSPAIHSLLPTVASCPFEPRYPASPVLSHLCFLTCAFSPVLSSSLLWYHIKNHGHQSVQQRGLVDSQKCEQPP